jgi:hypothetical protein
VWDGHTDCDDSGKHDESVDAQVAQGVHEVLVGDAWSLVKATSISLTGFCRKKLMGVYNTLQDRAGRKARNRAGEDK